MIESRRLFRLLFHPLREEVSLCRKERYSKPQVANILRGLLHREASLTATNKFYLCHLGVREWESLLLEHCGS